jgi:nitrilase
MVAIQPSLGARVGAAQISYVIGVNPCLHVDQIPADFPHRDRLWPNEHDDEGWVEHGNSVIIHPCGKVLAGPARHEETILYAEVDLAAVRGARRLFDPVGHYNRPDIFQLRVDTRSRPAIIRSDTADYQMAIEPNEPMPTA